MSVKSVTFELENTTDISDKTDLSAETESEQTIVKSSALLYVAEMLSIPADEKAYTNGVHFFVCIGEFMVQDARLSRHYLFMLDKDGVYFGMKSTMIGFIDKATVCYVLYGISDAVGQAYLAFTTDSLENGVNKDMVIQHVLLSMVLACTCIQFGPLMFSDEKSFEELVKLGTEVALDGLSNNKVWGGKDTAGSIVVSAEVKVIKEEEVATTTESNNNKRQSSRIGTIESKKQVADRVIKENSVRAAAEVAKKRLQKKEDEKRRQMEVAEAKRKQVAADKQAKKEQATLQKAAAHQLELEKMLESTLKENKKLKQDVETLNMLESQQAEEIKDLKVQQSHTRTSAARNSEPLSVEGVLELVQGLRSSSQAPQAIPPPVMNPMFNSYAAPAAALPQYPSSMYAGQPQFAYPQNNQHMNPHAMVPNPYQPGGNQHYAQAHAHAHYLPVGHPYHVPANPQLLAPTNYAPGPGPTGHYMPANPYPYTMPTTAAPTYEPYAAVPYSPSAAAMYSPHPFATPPGAEGLYRR